MGFFGGGLSFKTLSKRTRQTNDRTNFATRRNRGMHICHFDGFFQKSNLVGDQANEGSGWEAGSERRSVSRPISERLPTVKRLVMAR